MRTPLGIAIALAMLAALTVGLTSCGSYTTVLSEGPPSDMYFEPGEWYRVTLFDGTRFTDKVVAVGASSVEFRRRAVQLQRIDSVERHDIPDYKLASIVISALAYTGLVLYMR
ncbi:MAG: hypothetical protein GF400_08170 [Candidatus Eisenbacteria bacterium]|nr:hypothetical protein [Candidatus Eisenbacteria bacterium]